MARLHDELQREYEEIKKHSSKNFPTNAERCDEFIREAIQKQGRGPYIRSAMKAGLPEITLVYIKERELCNFIHQWGQDIWGVRWNQKYSKCNVWWSPK